VGNSGSLLENFSTKEVSNCKNQERRTAQREGGGGDFCLSKERLSLQKKKKREEIQGEEKKTPTRKPLKNVDSRNKREKRGG